LYFILLQKELLQKTKKEKSKKMEKENFGPTPEEWAEAENRSVRIFWIKVKGTLLLMGMLALYVILTSVLLKLVGISDTWIAVIESFSFAILVSALWRVKINIKLPGASTIMEDVEPQERIPKTVQPSKQTKRRVEKGSTEIEV